MSTRVGFGYDSHRFDPTRRLRLGGVDVPDAPGLSGHSDGDALAHAITDALLGAAGLGDIGQFFPDDDPRWQGADSLRFLREAGQSVVAAGYRVVNIDATVVAESPKLAPFVRAMRERLAATLGIAPSAVSVKGKTNEGMDAAGRGDGLVVYAVAAVAPR